MCGYLPVKTYIVCTGYGGGLRLRRLGSKSLLCQGKSFGYANSAALLNISCNALSSWHQVYRDANRAIKVSKIFKEWFYQFHPIPCEFAW